jgi:protein SCO1
MKRGIPMAASLAIIVAVVFGSLIWNRFIATTRSPQFEENAGLQKIPAPQVTLTDQNGRRFRLTDERGKAVVLFFGYAHCPDICPTTLARLAQANRSLGRQARQVVVAFVTVDPQRDTVSALKRYVDLFDPNFYGLTGTGPALNALYTAYHVWHQKLPNRGSAAGYLMAHSSAVYMIDRTGDLRAIHDWSDSPTVLAHAMSALLQ